jgi:hypothetical protein
VVKPKAKLTREALHESLKPPNNCRVKAFRDTLDTESRDVLDEALGYSPKDYPSSAIRKFLLDCGFEEDVVPGDGAIQDHRRGARPCRCRG